jgi:hypothetical protein
MKKIKWFAQPEDHDYPAADSYLSLIYSPDKVELLVDELRHTTISYFKAKDVFRASKESLLGVSNSHVKKNLKKVKKGKKLSPILLVRTGDELIIADGYHRICAIYSLDEDAVIPCKIV